MNSNPFDIAADRAKQRPTPSSTGLVTWMAIVFIGHAFGSAAFVALGGLMLGIPVNRLFLPFVTLCYCGLVLSPLLYWAHLSREQPKSCAIRFAVVMFFYLQMVGVALGIISVRLGLLSLKTAVNGYGPWLLPLSAVASLALYFGMHQMLEPISKATP